MKLLKGWINTNELVAGKKYLEKTSSKYILMYIFRRERDRLKHKIKNKFNSLIKRLWK